MMKHLLLTISLACLFLVACNNAPKQGQTPDQDSTAMSQDSMQPAKACCMTEEEKAACEAFKAKWDNWDNLTEEERVALVAEAKAKFDVMDSICKANFVEGQKCCKEAIEMTEEEKAACEAKKAEFDAQWANFSNLTIDEQKALIDAKISCKKAHECKGDSCQAPVAE